MLQQIIDVVRRADKEILVIYDKADVGVEYKGDDSPLTLADRVSNDIINTGLKEIAPDIPIISEENKEVPYETRKDWKRFWLVDPLDGTKEFIKKNGEFTVNIALIENGLPVLGVVSIPAQGKIYYGIKGEGAFRIDEEGKSPVRVEAKRRPGRSDGAAAAVSRSHLSEKDTALIEALGAETVKAGSALKFTLVAESKADLYPRFGPTWEWDTGAGHAVAEAAGAVVCGLDGKPLGYNKEVLKHPEGFLCCSDEIKDKALGCIKDM
jgi:3'(2'), 5'-bisphosphate nucleotidase